MAQVTKNANRVMGRGLQKPASGLRISSLTRKFESSFVWASYYSDILKRTSTQIPGTELCTSGMINAARVLLSLLRLQQHLSGHSGQLTNLAMGPYSLHGPWHWPGVRTRKPLTGLNGCPMHRGTHWQCHTLALPHWGCIDNPQS